MATTDDGRSRGTRLLAGLGLGWGLLLLLRPGEVAARLCPEFPAEKLWLVRVLGARLVAQHAVVAAAGDGVVVAFASAADLGHAATMVPFVRSPRYGRAARISGAIAAVSAGALPWAAIGPTPRLVDHQR